MHLVEKELLGLVD